MLKFAIVNVQPGPGRDIGLYEPDHLTGIEQAHMYFGPQKYDSEFPYGGPGVGKEDEVEPKVPSKDKKPKGKVLVKKMPKIVAAIDFDGTVTMNPRGFKRVIDKASKAGCECHLVTGRPINKRAEVEQYCKRYGIKFASMNFHPVPYDFESIRWDMLLDVRIGAWKARKFAELGINVAVDDNPIHIAQFMRKIPGLLVLKPLEG